MIFKKEMRTTRQEEIIDITPIVSQVVSKSEVKEGICTVFVPHTTAAVTINENADPDVKRDILAGLSSFDLESINFAHREGNSPAHIKSSLMGSSVTVIFSNGKLVLGTWQGIYFCEFDGPRNRQVIIHYE